MSNQQMTAWRCNKGHTLGMVQRDGHGIRQLILYRQAIAYTADTPEDIDVIAILEGHAQDVRCSQCGSVRTWVPGQEAINKLLAEARRMRRV
jgi:hypothetical protein